MDLISFGLFPVFCIDVDSKKSFRLHRVQALWSLVNDYSLAPAFLRERRGNKSPSGRVTVHIHLQAVVSSFQLPGGRGALASDGIHGRRLFTRCH